MPGRPAIQPIESGPHRKIASNGAGHQARRVKKTLLYLSRNRQRSNYATGICSGARCNLYPRGGPFGQFGGSARSLHHPPAPPRLPCEPGVTPMQRYYGRGSVHPVSGGGPGPFRCDGYVPQGTIRDSWGHAIPLAELPPFLRALLVTDGTVTKILEAYFWEPVVVDTLSSASRRPRRRFLGSPWPRGTAA